MQTVFRQLLRYHRDESWRIVRKDDHSPNALLCAMSMGCSGCSARDGHIPTRKTVDGKLPLYDGWCLVGCMEEAGVGPAIGYVTSEESSCVFVSSDGDDWSRLITDYQLLVDPVYTHREPGTTAMSCSRPHPESLLEGFVEPQAAIVVYENELMKPYPNPFNPKTVIAFTLKDAGPAELVVFDIRGRRVKEIHSGNLGQGRHEIQWYGKNSQGGRVASGVYFARLKIVNELQVQRMMLLK